MLSDWYQENIESKSEEEIKSIDSYYTLHGSKGLEFDNVVVILQDKFARKTDYCKYFLKIIILQLLRIIDFKKFVTYFM